MKRLVLLGIFIMLSGCGIFVGTKIHLTRPRGGETWKLGTSEKISWHVYDVMGSCCHSVNAYVRFKSERINQVITIADSRSSVQEPNAGTIVWRVGTTLEDGDKIVLKAGSYTIGVCDSEYKDVCAESGMIDIIE